jgi:hypothetical protein
MDKEIFYFKNIRSIADMSYELEVLENIKTIEDRLGNKLHTYLLELDERLHDLNEERELMEEHIIQIISKIKKLREHHLSMLKSHYGKLSEENKHIEMLWKELSLLMNLTKLNILNINRLIYNNDPIIQLYVVNKNNKIVYMEINRNDENINKSEAFWESMNSIYK